MILNMCHCRKQEASNLWVCVCKSQTPTPSLQVPVRRQEGGLKCAITSRIDLFGGWGLFTGACPSNDLRFPGWIFLFLPTNDAAPYLPRDAWFISRAMGPPGGLSQPAVAMVGLSLIPGGERVKMRIGSSFFFTTRGHMNINVLHIEEKR